jgi:hypothetical protein
MKTVLTSAALIAAAGFAMAKLAPPDDATQAKAAEAAAKTAWQAKVDAYQLCKVQDKVAAAYGKSKGASNDGKAAKSASAPAVAAASAAQPAASAASAGSAATGTPVVYSPPPPCADPGPFAYNPPEQKPLETSEAHSPAGNATSPPSVKPNSADMAPKK